MSEWHPDAIHVPLGDAGGYTGGKPKLVWHTTEGPAGSGLGAISAYRSSGSNPTFQLDPSNGKLWQFMPLNRTAKALRHPAGTNPTNSDHCAQVELVGRAAQSGSWPASYYARIAKLARWIEANAGVPRQPACLWRGGRLTWTRFHNASGHLGHMHVPYNDHVDPGTGFRIDLVLGGPVSRNAARLAKWRAELKKRRTQLKTEKNPGRVKYLIRRIGELVKAIRKHR